MNGNPNPPLERGRYLAKGRQGEFYTNDLSLARSILHAYDEFDEWYIIDLETQQELVLT